MRFLKKLIPLVSSLFMLSGCVSKNKSVNNVAPWTKSSIKKANTSSAQGSYTLENSLDGSKYCLGVVLTSLSSDTRKATFHSLGDQIITLQTSRFSGTYSLNNVTLDIPVLVSSGFSASSHNYTSNSVFTAASGSYIWFGSYVVDSFSYVSGSDFLQFICLSTTPSYDNSTSGQTNIFSTQFSCTGEQRTSHEVVTLPYTEYLNSIRPNAFDFRNNDKYLDYTINCGGNGFISKDTIFFYTTEENQYDGKINVVTSSATYSFLLPNAEAVNDSVDGLVKFVFPYELDQIVSVSFVSPHEGEHVPFYSFYVSNSDYYDGYNAGVNSQADDLKEWEEFYNGLLERYNNLVKEYDALRAGDTTFTGLFTAIASVPVAVLNGLNTFVLWGTPLITAIITLLFLVIVLWIIKKVI